MATNTNKQHNLPSSIPAAPPPATRRRPKKRVNSFDKLASTPLPSSTSNPTHEAERDQESLLTRIILTPVLFTSFILSLFVVNTRNRALRVEAHSSSSSFLSSLLPATSEPYQDQNDSKWSHRNQVGHVEPNDAVAPSKKRKNTKKNRSWHLHKKIRKVAKLEINDAFEMRRRVILIMLGVMVLGSIVLWVAMRRLMVALSGVTANRSKL